LDGKSVERKWGGGGEKAEIQLAGTTRGYEEKSLLEWSSEGDTVCWGTERKEPGTHCLLL